MKKLLAAFSLVGIAALAAPAYATPPGGPHTPVTICHKPGTPAEHTLIVDDDAVPGHLGHGDYLGACQTPEEPPENPDTPDEPDTPDVPDTPDTPVVTPDAPADIDTAVVVEAPAPADDVVTVNPATAG